MCVLFCLCVQMPEFLTSANLLESKMLCKLSVRKAGMLEVSSNSHGVRWFAISGRSWPDVSVLWPLKC
jgi:hypothetical protein